MAGFGCQNSVMNDHVSPADLRRMSVADRFRLMEKIWTSLIEAPGGIEIPKWHRQELDRRIADPQEGAAPARPWSDVQKEIRAGLRKP